MSFLSRIIALIHGVSFKKYNDILKYAKEMGYIDIRYCCIWKKYVAFTPIYSKKTAFIGPPLKILYKNKEIRMTTYEESMEILDK